MMDELPVKYSYVREVGEDMYEVAKNLKMVQTQLMILMEKTKQSNFDEIIEENKNLQEAAKDNFHTIQLMQTKIANLSSQLLDEWLARNDQEKTLKDKEEEIAALKTELEESEKKTKESQILLFNMKDEIFSLFNRKFENLTSKQINKHNSE